MTVFASIILGLWILFLAVWAISAIGAKRTLGGARAWGIGAALRLGLLVLVLLILRVPATREALRRVQALTAGSVAAGLIGVGLCAVGIGLAIFARVYLGRNWGMPMTRKEHPELVTGGPYAFVRHPIYTGVILAMVGSAIALSMVWLLVLIPVGAYFIYSARREEQLMTAQFPEQYPSYMRRTKMLLPFVL